MLLGCLGKGGLKYLHHDSIFLQSRLNVLASDVQVLVLRHSPQMSIGIDTCSYEANGCLSVQQTAVGFVQIFQGMRHPLIESIIS